MSVVLPGSRTSCTGSTDCDEDAAKEGGTEEKCEGKVSPIKRDVAEGSRSRCPLVVRKCRLAFRNDAQSGPAAVRKARLADSFFCLFEEASLNSLQMASGWF